MNGSSLSPEAVHRGNLILVNAEYGLISSQETDLVSVHNSVVLLERRASAALDSLMAEIAGWGGIVPVSGWRSQNEQQSIWDDTIATEGLAFTQKYVALPGHSEHQTGLAIDLGRKQDEIDFICPEFPDTGLCGLFRELAADFGFIERYPSGKESITGIGHEPWHFRYVGIPHAAAMKKEDFVLEEYIMFLRQNCDAAHPYLIDTDEGMFDIFSLSLAETVALSGTESHHCTISGDNIDGFIATRPHSSKKEALV